MNSSEKRTLTEINKLPQFKKVIEKLTTDSQLSESEKVYILSCAIIFLKHYSSDSRFTSYAEFAYYVILKYSIYYNDYLPLYDFSANFGFYPIVKAIFDNKLLTDENINDCFVSIELERFTHESYIETIHQYKEKKSLLEDRANELSYIAPTSFGKSSVIVDYIRKYSQLESKIVIVVPTKSLLMQTYRMIKNAGLGKKIIIHDEMYQSENSFIAIFTQERSLRLLSKNVNIYFDILFIDEAHNILNDDSRSILLSRLISKNRLLNPNQKTIYLSPLIDDVNSLKILKEQTINEHKIPFNIKEPEIFEYKLDKNITKYNRFVNEHYQIGISDNLFKYIVDTSLSKNFLYNYRPVSIEALAQKLTEFIPSINITTKVRELISILKQEVHEKFYIIDYIEHGIIYLHGKLPDLIKEYLESKFSELTEIKYVIANSVILEGMNLPIDNLYILNTTKLQGKELTNLIGRVNRLNTIFTSNQNNLNKLLPSVHFVNSEDYNRRNGNMTNKIELLRSRTFKDIIENPTLESFQFDDEVNSDKNIKNNKIRENEKLLNNAFANPIESLKQYLIETGIAEFYNNIDNLTIALNERISKVPTRLDWVTLGMMEKIADLFISGINYIDDFEFSRLENQEARKYYDFHITVNQKLALKQNINHMVDHFKKLITDDNPIFYSGDSYGEVDRNGNSNTRFKSYVDLNTKTEAQLINLAIVKLKMEDDFVSFKLNKFIIMMHDYNLISNDDYNIYIYGTSDQIKINLTKIGLSVSLISRLENDNQLQYIYPDEFNNLKTLPAFDAYKQSANDFYRFEIERFLN